MTIIWQYLTIHVTTQNDYVHTMLNSCLKYMSYANIEELADTRQMDAIADEPAVQNDYREASLRYLQVMTSALDWIATNGSPRVAAHAVAMALGVDTVCQGRSMSDIAQELGVSPAAMSKQVKQFRQTVDVEDSAYVYHK